MRRVIIALVLVFSTASEVSPSSAAAKFKNCTEMRRSYPRGVAKTKSAAKLTNAKYAPSVYAVNSKMDRDKDGAACES